MQSSATPALTVIILAAGESSGCGPAAPRCSTALCGRPLIDYPIAVPPGPSEAGSCWWSGARPMRFARRWGRRPTWSTSSRRSAWAPGTRCCRRAARAGTDRGRSWSSRATCPCSSDGDAARGSSSTTATTGAAATVLTAWWTTHRLRPRGREQRPAGRHRRASGRHAPSSGEIREIGTSVYCFDAARFWPALAQVTPAERPGRVLPHRRDRHPAAGGAQPGGGGGRGSARVPGRQRPEAARRSSLPSSGVASSTGSWRTA